MNSRRSSNNSSDRNLLQLCFPCLGRTGPDCDDMMVQSFGREFTEYEYVIENLAIRRAPKVLLDSRQPPPKVHRRARAGQTEGPKTRDFGGGVSKGGPEVAVGPVLRGAVEGETSRRHDTDGAAFAPHQAMAGLSPCYMAATPKRMHHSPRLPCKTKDVADKGFVSHEDVMKKTLVPPNNVLYRAEVPQKVQVSADVHKNNEEVMDEYTKKAKGIPTEIQDTINALKVARPTTFSKSPRKNHRNLVRSVSDTSCDKETFCNFLGLDSFKEETTEETRSSQLDYRYMENKRKPFSQFRKRATSAKRLGSVLGMFTLNITFSVANQKISTASYFLFSSLYIVRKTASSFVKHLLTAVYYALQH